MKRLFIAFTVVIFAPGLAAQELKNVQLLKGLTPTQLQRTMNMIRSSLGVHCDFCHVAGDKEWDFASDEKPAKKRARRMIQMVMDLNSSKYFDRTAVSCNTCHRGSTRPVSVVSLPQAQPPFPTTVEQKPALPSRDEVVAKYASAMGNVDAAALSSLQMKGVRESSRGSAPIELLVAPGKVRIVATTSEGEVMNVIDGDAGWIRDAGGTRPINPNQVEHMTQLADAFRTILPAEIPPDAKVTAREKDAWVITMPWRAGGRQLLYFDVQSGLLVKRVTMMTTAIGDVPQQTEYSDYRDTGGVKLPYLVKFDSVDPWIGAARRYSEIRTVKVDSKVFEKP